MDNRRAIHKDFMFYLKDKDSELIKLYCALRNFIIDQNESCNEMLYHTHALTSVYSVSKKMSDAYCMIPIYTNHLNLGFNKGTLLHDPDNLLQGTGKWIRHIPVRHMGDFNKRKVRSLIQQSFELALDKSDSKGEELMGLTINKIKPIK